MLQCATLALGVLASCVPDRSEPGALVVSGRTMGTLFTVTVPGAGSTDEGPVATAVQAELELVDARMSTYRDDSELSRFNRHGSPSPFPLSEETHAVVAAAQAVSRLTGGAFDITVGPLVDAWGFGPARRSNPPSEAELERLRAHTGWRKLQLGESATTLAKEVQHLQCDLSAIAKGYAVDRVADALEGLGFTDYLVEVGGEVRAGGLNAEHERWRVGVERPDESGRLVQRVVEISNIAVATSGDYRNYRETDGARLSHLIDPRTGRPASTRVASATVLDASAMRADALATAMLVLGEAKGLELAAREGLEVLLLIRRPDGTVREAPSAQFRARMRH